jgi:galactose mutarotase-like enzyme
VLHEDRQHNCRIHEYGWRGHQLAVMENEVIRVSVVPTKGADVVELRHKPSDIDYLWHSPHPLLPPGLHAPTAPTDEGSFFDQYHGGWQESLPSGNGASAHAGAHLGLHGEVATLPWDVRVERDDPESVAMRFSVLGRRTPLRLLRTMSLRSASPTLVIDEEVVNEGEEEVPFVWGHHIALGPPFLSRHCRIEVPGASATVPSSSRFGRYAPGSYRWPDLSDRDGRTVDAGAVPPKDIRTNDSLYLSELGEGRVVVRNPELDLAIALRWDLPVFPYLWCWQAFGGLWGYPYYGRAYLLAIEPFNAPISSLDQAVHDGTARTLAPGGRLNTRLSVRIGPEPESGDRE